MNRNYRVKYYYSHHHNFRNYAIDLIRGLLRHTVHFLGGYFYLRTIARRPTGVNPGGGGDGGDVSPPLFWVGGMACTNIPPPPLFEDKITSNLTFIVKKLTFLTVKLLKTPKIARSPPLACTQMYSETRSLRFCQYMYSFLDIIYVKKGIE